MTGILNLCHKTISEEKREGVNPTSTGWIWLKISSQASWLVIIKLTLFGYHTWWSSGRRTSLQQFKQLSLKKQPFKKDSAGHIHPHRLGLNMKSSGRERQKTYSSCGQSCINLRLSLPHKIQIYKINLKKSETYFFYRRICRHITKMHGFLLSSQVPP